MVPFEPGTLLFLVAEIPDCCREGIVSSECSDFVSSAFGELDRRIRLTYS